MKRSRSPACTGTSSTWCGSSFLLSFISGRRAAWIWLLLFVFSAFSYMVDYFQLQGALRWTLILLFMLLKASFIVAIFMHMAWERLALKLAILVPPLTLLVLIALMAIEGDYTFLTRLASFVR